MNKTARLLLFGQVSFVGFLIICSLLNPHFIKTQGGVSNYGVHWLTVIPYTLAFSLCVLFTILAARSITTVRDKSVSGWLYVLAGLYALLLISTYPYKINRTLDNLHILVAIILFSATLLMSCLLVVRTRYDKLIVLLFITLLAGNVIAGLSLGKVFHLLYTGQVINSASFALLLVISTQKLMAKSHK